MRYTALNGNIRQSVGCENCSPDNFKQIFKIWGHLSGVKIAAPTIFGGILSQVTIECRIYCPFSREVFETFRLIIFEKVAPSIGPPPGPKHGATAWPQAWDHCVAPSMGPLRGPQHGTTAWPQTWAHCVAPNKGPLRGPKQGTGQIPPPMEGGHCVFSE